MLDSQNKVERAMAPRGGRGYVKSPNVGNKYYRQTVGGSTHMQPNTVFAPTRTRGAINFPKSML